MKKSPIAILDEGIHGINFFNYLSKKYKYEDGIQMLVDVLIKNVQNFNTEKALLIIEKIKM